MADEETEQEQRTEAPSERRLQHAFDTGDIAFSRDVVSAGVFICTVVALTAAASSVQGSLLSMVAQVVRLSPNAPFASLSAIVLPVALPLLVTLLAAAAGGLALTMTQTRAHLWEEKVTPDFSRTFSTERIKRLVSKELVQDIALGALKALIIAWVCWHVLRDDFLTLGRLMHAQPGEQLRGLFAPIGRLGLMASVALAALAGADLAVVRWRHRKKLMMTKDEVKREMKEDEGDPLIKGARRRRHRELSRKNALAETRKADALIVNPTHIAIAVRYRKEEGAAPRVLAKGKGALAEVMREEARNNGIAIVQDIALARLLYRKVKIGGQVPADTYKAVAAILAFVYRMTGKTPRSSVEGASL